MSEWVTILGRPRDWQRVAFLSVLGLLPLSSCGTTGNPHVSINYNEAKDATSVSLEDAWVTTSRGNLVKVEASYATPGRQVSGPGAESVKLSFQSHSVLYVYQDSHTLSVIADERRFDYEDTEWRGWLVTTNEAGLFFYAEDITTEIPGSDFEEITKAENVRVELGPTRFDVSQKVLQVMRQMVGRIDLPADS